MKTRLLLSLVLISFLSGCVSRRPAPEPGPQPETPSLTGSPADAAGLPSITLVVGGAGVASFATVGLLRKLHEEGVRIDAIFATGWPALFATAYGMLKSVHDLEWFSMRLKEEDFFPTGIFDSGKNFFPHDKISELTEKAFGNRALNQGKVPLFLQASDTGSPAFESAYLGAWKTPLLKSISVPGTFRPYPSDGHGLGWISSTAGLDIAEASKRGSKLIVAVSMYEDYLQTLGDIRREDAETVFRLAFATQLSKNIKQNMALATIGRNVFFGKSPKDFSMRRQALQAGASEALKIIQQVRKLQ